MSSLAGHGLPVSLPRRRFFLVVRGGLELGKPRRVAPGADGVDHASRALARDGGLVEPRGMGLGKGGGVCL